ncbi:MAG: hypothetical protein ACRCZ0_06295 [Cetobacterium sp.]
MGSHMKETIKEMMELNYSMMEKVIYEEVYAKVEAEIKAKQRELEENAYTTLNGNTYVDLEYEVETNKRRFGFEISNIKRTYLGFGSLIRDEKTNKYIPNEKADIFIMKDGKLYIKQDELSLLYLVYTEQRFHVKNMYSYMRGAISQGQDKIVEHLYNISSVEHKQKSPLFEKIRLSQKEEK